MSTGFMSTGFMSTGFMSTGFMSIGFMSAGAPAVPVSTGTVAGGGLFVVAGGG
jgi:hypothetical protein